MSVADDFIDVMARLKAIEPDTDHPMRYSIWRCKEAAYKVIIEALNQARDITDAARLIHADYADEMKGQAAKPKQEQS